MELAFGFGLQVLLFLIMLSVLVFAHELGHFVVAKLCGIYCPVFSIGMGKRVWGFKVKETDYRISAIPIGGYVRMVGQSDLPEDPDAVEEDPYAAECPDDMRFDAKPIPKRLAVSFAGPAASLLFGVFVYWIMFMVGIPVSPGQLDTRIGYVLPDSPAARAGIHMGDRIVQVGDETPADWESLQLAIIGRGESPTQMVLEDANGKRRTVTVTPEVNEATRVAAIGVDYYQELKVEEVFSGSAAARGGLETGDVITAMRTPDGELEPAAALQSMVRDHAGEPLTMQVLRHGERRTAVVTPGKVITLAGLELDGTTVVGVNERALGDLPGRNLPQPGDQLSAVDGAPVTDASPEALGALLGDAAGHRVPVTFTRPGGLLSSARTWTVLLETEQRGLIGIMYGLDTVVQRFGPLAAVPRAVERFHATVDQTIDMFRFMLGGAVSATEMSGPIGIARISAQVAQFGLIPYLHLVALITINLGILNLLPIPILDGGMMMILLVEGLRRRPLSGRTKYYLQHAGLVIVGCLIIFATFNDLRRYLEDFIQFIG